MARARAQRNVHRGHESVVARFFFRIDYAEPDDRAVQLGTILELGRVAGQNHEPIDVLERVPQLGQNGQTQSLVAYKTLFTRVCDVVLYSFERCD